MAPAVRELLDPARARLRASPHEPSAREAALLLGHVLGWTEAQVMARDDRPVDAESARRFEWLLVRRIAGEPWAYVVGEREFYGRGFAVDRRVLIPRPETEHLVEACLDLDLPPEARVVDVGSGSGCIAISLGLERPGWRIVALDKSPGALAVARANVERHRAGNVACVASDLLTALPSDSLDLVVSNPPYISPRDAPELSSEITEHEPHDALFADDDGLAVYRLLFAALPSTARGGAFAVEIGAGQAATVVALAEAAGFASTGTIADLSGVERVVIGNRSAVPSQ